MFDPALVTLSVLIAAVASYTALDLSGRIRAYRGAVASAWLAAAAIAMGGGIWSMHFVAMLAYAQPGLEVAYDPTLTLASLVLAIGVTGIAFKVSSRPGSGALALGLAGLFMGLGVVTMHYTGMRAMRMHAHMTHDPFWVGAAGLIAVAAATGALWLTSADGGSGWRRWLAALAMGFAISGMHYVGMLGVDFEHAELTPAVQEASDITRTTLVLAVSGTTFVTLFLALVASLFDRRIAELSAREAAALRRSEERSRELYRQTPLPLHALDARGIVEQVSDEWLDLLGRSRDEVLGRPLTDFMEPESARGHAASGLADQRQAERRFLSKDGRVLDVLLSTRVERDADGRFLRALGGLVDVTARKQAEAALRQSQKIEAIGQLTGGVAHDFNNLLAVVLGNLELLGRRLPDDPRLRRLLDGAVQGAHRGAALTQRLLAFSRRQDLRPEPVEVPALVAGITDLVAKAVGPSVAIEADFPRDLPRAQVDANQLELAIVNLALNARDAMPEGGRVRVTAAAVTIGHGAPCGLVPARYLRLDVSDTGHGMDEATLARASEPFFTTKGVGKGTGLGLSMVQGLAEQSGGRIDLESALGAGTRVSLWLPVAGSEPVPIRPREAEAAPGPGGEGLRLLVVDDDPLVLLSTVEMLRDLGYATVEAGSGEEALARLRSDGPFDAVVTDHAMPGMTGAQLAERLAEGWPGLPVLMVTGYAEAGGRTEGRLPTLGKPFGQEGLARAVRACLDARATAAVAAE